MLPKPPDCATCPLEKRGFGHVPPAGPITSPVLIFSEAAGKTEAARGTPFVGPAGAMLKRAMRLGGMDQDWFRIDNLLKCQPPGDWLSGAPWEHDAIAHCMSNYGKNTLAENHPVVVTAGGLATRHILELAKTRYFKIGNFHGTVQRDPQDRFWVVPTFHPSFLQRGATNLMDVLRFDLTRAIEIARRVQRGGGYLRQPYVLTCDPGVLYFAAWAELYLKAVADPNIQVDLVVDIETPDSSTVVEDSRQDISWSIIRINFAMNGEEGLTVPFEEPYITTIRKILAAPGDKIFWNAKFDAPRLLKAGFPIGGEWYDYMWAWHVLQSALPRGLGFVAPFYTDSPPWKHLADTNPEEYGAFDGFVPWRIAQGITRDLVDQGLWMTFKRHVHDFHRDILDPAEDIGLLLSRVNLIGEDGKGGFRAELKGHEDRLDGKLQELVPVGLHPLEKKDGWKTLSKKILADPWGLYGEKVVRVVKVCRSCEAIEIAKTHRCKDRSLTPEIEPAEALVVRYFRRQGRFNPNSYKQVLVYIKSKGHKPGRDPKTKGETTAKEVLEGLYKRHADPFYKYVLDYRHIAKVRGTYIDGSLNRMDSLDRVHPTFTCKPSTMRMAAENPNTMNVIDDKEGDNAAAGFRKCIIAGDEAYVAKHLEHLRTTTRKPIELHHRESCVLLESDYAGIEAVLVGWLCGDPEYVRFAHLGIHGRLAAILLDKPADPKWSDDELTGYFKQIKGEDFYLYDRAKRNVHGSNYGLTVVGMQLRYPELFPTQKDARHVQNLYWSMAPKVRPWQMSLRMFTHEHHYLGGPPGTPPAGHPYGYKHRFYDVISYRPITPTQAIRREARGNPVLELGGKPMAVEFGSDAKKCVAFFPQSIARGVITEAMINLYDPRAESPNYIGDAYFGRTPLRTPVHDSLLNEVPESQVDRVVEALVREMIRPIEQLPCPAEWGIGSHLNFGVEVKLGTDWGDKKRGGTMETIFGVRGGGVGADGMIDVKNLTGVERIGVAGDLRAVPSEPDEFSEEEEVVLI